MYTPMLKTTFQSFCQNNQSQYALLDTWRLTLSRTVYQCDYLCNNHKFYQIHKFQAEMFRLALLHYSTAEKRFPTLFALCLAAFSFSSEVLSMALQKGFPSLALLTDTTARKV
jgi:hypothetical protein